MVDDIMIRKAQNGFVVTKEFDYNKYREYVCISIAEVLELLVDLLPDREDRKEDISIVLSANM